MIIAVNAVTPAFKPAAASFFQTIFLKIALQQPQHQFVFIGFTAAAAQPAPNCTFVNNGLVIKSPLRFKYWLNYQLPSLLKKNNADLLVNYHCCSLRLQTPQLMYADEVSFLNHPEFYPKNWLAYLKKYTPLFLQKASRVITSSLFLQAAINKEYAVDVNKIAAVYKAADDVFKPAVHWNQKETVKEQLTDGKDFFLYSGPIHEQYNLIHLLKAFSFFKQRQKSNMQLVLASLKEADNSFIKTLSSYKYRADVVLAENITAAKLAAITTAAYAAILPSAYDDCSISAIQALQCNTPVIAANSSSLPEICGEAAVYCYPDDFNDIAAKMMLLFTNEDRRNLLIAKSREQAQKFDKTAAAAQLWHLIEHFNSK